MVDVQSEEYEHQHCRVYSGSILGRRIYIQPRALTILCAHLLRGRDDRPVIVLGNPNSLTAWGAAILGRLFRRRVMFWTHGARRRELGVKARLRKAFLSLPSHVLLYGQRAKDLLVDLGIDGARLSVIGNANNSAVVLAAAGTSRTEFLFVGRLESVKRVDLILAAMALTVNTQGTTPYKLRIVGSGTQEERLTRQRDEMGLGSYVDIDPASYAPAELAETFGRAIATIIPNGGGLLVLHSLEHGVPVIYGDRLEEHFPEIEAAVDDPSSVPFTHDDPSALAAAMTIMAERQWRRARPLDTQWTPAGVADAVMQAARRG